MAARPEVDVNKEADERLALLRELAKQAKPVGLETKPHKAARKTVARKPAAAKPKAGKRKPAKKSPRRKPRKAAARPARKGKRGKKK